MSLKEDARKNNDFFDANYEELLEKYNGKVVIIAQGKLEDVCEDMDEASEKAKKLSENVGAVLLWRIGDFLTDFRLSPRVKK